MRANRIRILRWAASITLILTAAGFVAGQTRQPARPKVLVVLVLDQFRADYLDRFASRFGPNGFERLKREGAWFRSAYYPSESLETAPGHASLATGTTPSRHGIAGNRWYDAQQKRVVEAIEDKDSPIIGSADGLTPASPKNLLGSTLSDEMRLATLGRSRAFGVSLKDRAAILSTGHGGSGVYWFDAKQGGFITSKYYREALPEWVMQFNRKHPAQLPLDAFMRSAESNQLLADFAFEMIAREKIGQTGATDFLFIGFSSIDYAGHRWGPYSTGIEELVARTDATMAGLLSKLDQAFGKDGYWLAFSADHGVAPTLVQAHDPQMARLAGKNIDSKALYKAVEDALTARWGDGPWLIPGAGLNLDRETLSRHSVSLDDAARAAGEAAMTVDGVLGYVTSSSAVGDERTVQAFRLSRFPGRSADIEIIPEAFSLLDGERGGTSHGVPYTYDSHVPIILMGPPFRPGRYSGNISTSDLAPTLADALGVNPPALCTGRVLVEALREAPAGSATTRPASRTAQPAKH